MSLALVGMLIFGYFFFLVAENRRPGFLPDRTLVAPPTAATDEPDDDDWGDVWNDVEIDLPPDVGSPLPVFVPKEQPSHVKVFG